MRATRKHTAFVVILFSYLVIILLFMVGGAVIFERTVSVVRSEALLTVQAEIEKYRDLLQYRLDDMMMQVLRRATSPRINDLLYSGVTLADGVNLYRVRETWLDLSTRPFDNDIVAWYFIYVSSGEYVISEHITYLRLSMFDADLFSLDGLDFSRWKDERLALYAKQAFGFSTQGGLQGKSMRVVPYVTPLPYYNADEHRGYFVVFLDVARIESVMAEVRPREDAELLIRNHDGSFICCNLGTEAESIPIPISPTTGYFQQDVSGVPMVVFHAWLSSPPWSVAWLVPTDRVFENVRSVRIVFAVFLGLGLGLGLLLALYFSYTNTQPLRMIVQRIRRDVELAESESSYEYDIITDSVGMLVSRNRSLEHELHERDPLVRSAWLYGLLRGTLPPETTDEVARQLARKGCQYAVLLIKVVRAPGTDGESGRHYRLIKDGITGLLLSRAPVELEISDSDIDELAVVTCVEDRSHRDTLPALSRAAASIKQYAARHYDVQLLIVGGPFVKDIRTLRASYLKAREMLSYKYVDRANLEKIIWYREETEALSYYFPINVELQLMTSVRASDTGAVSKVLDRVARLNFGATPVSPQGAAAIVSELTHTVHKLNDEVNEGEKTTGVAAALRTAMQSYDVEDAFALIREQLLSLCARFDAAKRSHNDTLLRNILDYISINYTDPSIGLKAIAGRFGIGEAYVSQFFKEQHGDNFHDYLVRQRIGKACALLRTDPAISVTDVSALVGYRNPDTFRKAFRKIAGGAPAEYRRQKRLRS